MKNVWKKLIIALLIITLILIPSNFVDNGPITLTVAVYSGNSWGVPQHYAYKIYDEAAEHFEKEYGKDVKIVLKTGVMYNDFSDWFAKQVLMGEETDVFLILEEDFSTYASIGLFEDLSTYLARDSDDYNDIYYNKALEAGQYKGTQYSLPISVVPSFLIVNKTLLNENNITIDFDNWDNWTWEAFYNICKAVTKDTDKDGQIDQFGVFGYEWDNAFYTNDERLFDVDGRKTVFSTDNFIETVRYLKDLYNLNRGINVKEAEFDKGKVAFKKFNLSEYRAYGTYPYKIIKYADFEWDVIPFPKGPQGQSKSKLYTLQIGISSRGRNKQIAYDFIKYMTSNEDLQEKVWELTYTLPANKNTVKRLYEEKKYKYEEFRKLNPDLLSDMISNSYRDPDFKLYSRLRKVIEQSIFEIMVRDLDVPRNVMELKKELQYVLDNYIGY